MPLITDIGHLIIQVKDMDEALVLYRDTLGLEIDPLQSRNPVWKVLRTKGGSVTLYKRAEVVPLVLEDPEASPIELHVADFEQAAKALRAKGYSVKASGENAGTLIDPWGNRIRLHDHRRD